MRTDGLVTYEDPAMFRQHPAGEQTRMTGDDWLSDQDKRRQSRADAALKRASVKAAADMRRAAESVRAQFRAYMEAGHPNTQGLGDGRLTMASDLDELAAFFESVYGGDK
jgi:hypothetical protein